MSKSTTRRAVLAGAAALPLASLPAVADVHPDAELLALVAELDEAQRAVMAVEERNTVEWEQSKVETDDAWEALEDACAERREIVHDILSIPAATIEGLCVKVTAVEFDSNFNDGGAIEPDEWSSIADDIRRLAGKAVVS